MGFESSVGQDVADLHTPAGKGVADEQRSVAVQWFLLRAHDRDPSIGCRIDQTPESVPKTAGAGDPLVADPAAYVAGGILRPPAEFPAVIGVADAPGLKRGGEGFAIEVRIEAAVRRGAHIGQGVDPISREQVQEEVQRVVGMADGEYEPGVQLTFMEQFFDPLNLHDLSVKEVDARKRDDRSGAERACRAFLAARQADLPSLRDGRKHKP